MQRWKCLTWLFHCVHVEFYEKIVSWSSTYIGNQVMSDKHLRYRKTCHWRVELHLCSTWNTSRISVWQWIIVYICLSVLWDITAASICRFLCTTLVSLWQICMSAKRNIEKYVFWTKVTRASQWIISPLTFCLTPVRLYT